MTHVPPRPRFTPAPPAPPRRWPKRLLIGFLVVANLAIFGGLAALWLAARHVASTVGILPSEGLGLSETPAGFGEPRTFLLIGSDSRADLAGQRADVIMLLQVIPERGALQILSIPRDTKVTIDGTTNRINAFFNDGAAGIVAAVSEFTGVPIHHYLEVDFAGFAGIVDAVGGLEMTFRYPTRDYGGSLQVEAGTQVLDGAAALSLARSRHYQELREGEWVYVEASDIGRTRRQQDLLMALLTQIDRPSSLSGFSELVDRLGGFVSADDTLREEEIIQLAWEMRSLAPEDLDALTLPVDGLEEGGVSYVVAREPEASLALAAFRAGEPLSAAVEGNGRLEVLNGNGVAGSAAQVAEQLRGGGWEVVAVTNSPRDYATTMVVARPRHLTQAEAVVAFLGYGQAAVGTVPDGADVVVIVGADAAG